MSKLQLDLRDFDFAVESIDPTFGEAITMHMDDLKRRDLSTTTIRTYQQHTKHLDAAHFTELRMSRITKKHVLVLRNALSDTIGSATANSILAFVSAVFNTVGRMSDEPVMNAAQGIRRLPTKPKRLVYTPETLPRLKAGLKQAPTPHRVALNALLYSGMRHGSLTGILDEDVDLERGILFLRDLKGRPAGCVLPINRQLARQFKVQRQVKEMLRPDTPYLFVSARSRKGKVGSSLYPEVRSHLSGFSPHALRRTWASALTAVSAPHLVTKHLLSHVIGGAGGDVTELYVTVDADTAMEWSQKAANYLDEKMSREEHLLPDLR